MAGRLEHHHPAKSTKTSLIMERIEGRRRQLGFSHIWKMMPCGQVKRKTHINPKEVSSASVVAKQEALGGRWLLMAASHELQMISYNPEQELVLQTDMGLQGQR